MCHRQVRKLIANCLDFSRPLPGSIPGFAERELDTPTSTRYFPGLQEALRNSWGGNPEFVSDKMCNILCPFPGVLLGFYYRHDHKFIELKSWRHQRRKKLPSISESYYCIRSGTRSVAHKVVQRSFNMFSVVYSDNVHLGLCPRQLLSPGYALIRNGTHLIGGWSAFYRI